MELWLWLFLLFVLLMVLWFYNAVRPRTSPPGPGMPGPRTLPVLGNLLDVATPQPHITLMKLAAQHGPVYCLRLVDHYVVVVTDYDTIMDVTVRKGEAFRDRVPPAFRLQQMSKVYHNISLQDTSPAWTALKKISQRALRAYGMGLTKVESVVTDMSHELFDIIRKAEGKPLDPRHSYYDYTLQIMHLFMVGEYISTDDPMFSKIKQMERLFIVNLGPGGNGALLDAAPWVRFLGNHTWKCLLKGWAISKEDYTHYKAKVMSSIEGTNEDLPVFQSALKAMRELRDDNGKLLLNDKWSEGILTDLFTAGITTTTTVMYTLTMVLAHYPEIQRRAKQEIEQVAPSCEVTLQHKGQFHYIRALIFEVLRNASIVPNALPRKATEETRLKGYNIPKDTIIFISQWTLHHDENHWEDPYEYKPERFLDEDGKLVAADHPNRQHLMPFGAGLRVCLGETFAMTRLLLFTAMLVQQFTLMPEGGHCDPGVCDPRGFNYGLVLYPPDMKVMFCDPSTPLTSKQ